MGNDEKFDRYATTYEALHASSVAASGEDPAYFHDYKVACLERLGVSRAEPLLDFGCGTGNLTERFLRRFDAVHGYDPSSDSLEVAKARAPMATFYSDVSSIPVAHFSTCVLSGVLHHVAPEGRRALLDKVRTSLRPGGRLVVFEHNPLNPLTRRAVAECEFDDDAILLYPWSAKRLLKDSGFSSVTLDYIVFFPRSLGFLRPLEPLLRGVVFGAQQMLVGRL